MDVNQLLYEFHGVLPCDTAFGCGTELGSESARASPAMVPVDYIGTAALHFVLAIAFPGLLWAP